MSLYPYIPISYIPGSRWGDGNQGSMVYFLLIAVPLCPVPLCNSPACGHPPEPVSMPRCLLQNSDSSHFIREIRQGSSHFQSVILATSFGRSRPPSLDRGCGHPVWLEKVAQPLGRYPCLATVLNQGDPDPDPGSGSRPTEVLRE